MKSLADSLIELEKDLSYRPARISAHSDMPYAIFVYPPAEEFSMRKHLRLFSIKLSQNHGRQVKFLSIARMVWDTIRIYGLEDLYKTEMLRGFGAAQKHVHQLITGPDFKPLTETVMEKISNLTPDDNVVFLVRAGGFAPSICSISWLLEGLHGKTDVPIIVFYPGSVEAGSDLRFFNLPVRGNLGAYNYRVKIYGVVS
ncbi:MAG TPA: DUF1788 domain-containing protein [Candidatus Saccharicenans sp.]|nr:DUF1788 domain-containing protein [Candidatus Saccharicenans sp.]